MLALVEEKTVQYYGLGKWNRHNTYVERSLATPFCMKTTVLTVEYVFVKR